MALASFVDYDDGATTTWPTAVAWAQTWFAEWRRDEFGPACEFINDLLSHSGNGQKDDRRG
jgi:hypothetical protein